MKHLIYIFYSSNIKFIKNIYKFYIFYSSNTNIIHVQIGPHIENRQTYNDNYCLLFNINLNYKKLYDVDLRKCSSLSGTEILNILEKIAKKFILNEIHLEDVSHINIISSTNKEYGLSLKNMYILSEGLSWYNKFGYISSNFEEEIIYNQRIMDMELLEYMSLILESNNNYLKEKILSSYNVIKKQFEQNINSLLIVKRKNKIKKIIINKYGNVNVTDDILYEVVKIYYKYDEERDNIIKKHEKFIEYLIHITSSNLINYIKNTSKISDIIKNFRKRIKEKTLDDCELEFIKYILNSSNKILKYDYKLIKII